VAAACGPQALGARLAAIMKRRQALPHGFTLADMAVERLAESGTPHPSSDLPPCR
jgi:hypothetical protein